MKEQSHKESRVRNMTNLYYSRKEVQKAIVDFCVHREVAPRYYDGFGKRPDVLDYPGDLFELVKRGATSFHCSEELWDNPLNISTDFTEEEYNRIRIGWDLLIDIDSRYIDYSKIMADLIIKFLRFHKIKNIGIKFSGSKGFHIIVPWKAFPKEINGVLAKDQFPHWPRIVTQYIMKSIERDLTKRIADLVKPSKYLRDFEAPKEVMPDLVLVSPRHLFRAPYSLHEKTALASVVLDPDNIADFELTDADPMKVKPEPFIPKVKEGEAKELLSQALDWYKDHKPREEKQNTAPRGEYAPIKLEKLSDDFLPPSIKNILKGIGDGRKRALFVLLGLFRAIGMERDEIEKRLEEWNKKNSVPLKKGYLKAQLQWSFRNKVVPPPNFDKDYYKGIGIIPTPEEMRMKNPVTYVLKKSGHGKDKKKKPPKKKI